jgi:hypothetical protein
MPAGRPKSPENNKRTEAVQALLTLEERAAFDQLALQMADELALGKIPDGIVVRRLILAELRRRGLYPPGAPKPNAQPEGEPLKRAERAVRGGQQARSGKRTAKR